MRLAAMMYGSRALMAALSVASAWSYFLGF